MYIGTYYGVAHAWYKLYIPECCTNRVQVGEHHTGYQILSDGGTKCLNIAFLSHCCIPNVYQMEHRIHPVPTPPALLLHFLVFCGRRLLARSDKSFYSSGICPRISVSSIAYIKVKDISLFTYIHIIHYALLSYCCCYSCWLRFTCCCSRV